MLEKLVRGKYGLPEGLRVEGTWHSVNTFLRILLLACLNRGGNGPNTQSFGVSDKKEKRVLRHGINVTTLKTIKM